MEPGQVWLNFIPCFNIVWTFITVIRVEESLQNEFADRGHRRQPNYGKNMGLASLILNLLGAIPYIGAIFGLLSLIFFIIYWVKIAGYSKELAEGASFRNERYEDDDYDDRDDRRRGRRDDYDDDEPRDPPPPRGGHYDEQKDDLDDKPWRRK